MVWFEGTFIKTVKGWQREWFYITEALADGQAGVEFSAGPQKKLVSWKRKGMDWGNPAEVKVLIQKIVFWIKERNIMLTDMVNVMLHRRILPLQSRATPMWAHKPEDAVSIHHFFRSTSAGIWKLLFKPSKDGFPMAGRDLGFETGHDTPEKWIPKAQQMLCPAPLPEGERTPLLVALLTEEPHVVIPKESRPPRGRVGRRGRETSVARSEETHASSTDRDEE